jgi:hypothetical protein
MHKYRSLLAWQRAHELALRVLEATDETYHPRARAVFDQLRRAAVSVEANIVEGYALGSPAQFRRHQMRRPPQSATRRAADGTAPGSLQDTP